MTWGHKRNATQARRTGTVSSRNDNARECAYIVSSKREAAMRLLLNWVLSALAVWIVAQVVPGVYVNGAIAALIAALAIGFINATIGFVLKVLTFPLTLLTLGLFWFVINALMLELASALVPGFHVRGFLAAFIGAI